MLADDFACVRLFDAMCDSLKDLYAPAKIDEIRALSLMTENQLFVLKMIGHFGAWMRFGAVPADKKRMRSRTRIYKASASYARVAQVILAPRSR